MIDYKKYPHRRYNPLTSEWVLVSPHRAQRPWQGRTEPSEEEGRSAYDPDCYLCPGNQRAGGNVNPEYRQVYVFENDFAALLPDTPVAKAGDSTFFKTESVQGECRVLCFSPRHDLTLAEMVPEKIRTVVDVWSDQTAELGKRHQWVQIFENKGAMMGCSNPHPHCQIWAGDCLPNEPLKEDINQKRYADNTGENLLTAYLVEEQSHGERVVLENRHFLVVVPFWALWPFETLLLPKRHVPRLPNLTEDERDALADILKRHLTGYDRLFGISFPYTMGWHGAPFNAKDNPHWQLHAHFYPPLLRSASVRKYMVGYEMLADAQRDMTAEQAAVMLRSMHGI